MKDNELVKKIANNRLILFIIPNLIYVYVLINSYNVNFLEYGEVFFSEVIILSLVFLLITSIIYIFLYKVLKDKHKVFCILTFITCFYFIRFSLLYFLLFIIFILLLVLVFKKFIYVKLDYAVVFISFIIFFLFSYSFIIFGSNLLYSFINSKGYDYNLSIKVEDKTDTPNIYWIHCDGMVGIGGMKKYFKYNDIHLLKYFYDNDFYFNEEATLITAHQTQESLTAMFNPYYYDNFFGDYLLDLEETYLKNKDNPSFLVNHHELEEKRLNNELFMALDKKNYTTVTIGDFNTYTGFYTDYYYDFFNDGALPIGITNNDLRLLGNNSKNKLLSYMRFTHLKPLIDRTILYSLSNINYLDYDNIDYNSFDSSNYEYIDKVMNKYNYWIGKAMIKGLAETMKIDNQKFVFLDFKIGHDPFTFDRFGNLIDEEKKFEVASYLGNYMYISHLLTDLLDYIRDNDKEAVIIVQGDHGLHTISDELMLSYFPTDMEGVQNIRNSVISAYYIPDKYKNGDEKYLNNPLNVSRYIVNNYIGNNYEYLD